MTANQFRAGLSGLAMAYGSDPEEIQAIFDNALGDWQMDYPTLDWPDYVNEVLDFQWCLPTVIVEHMAIAMTIT